MCANKLPHPTDDYKNPWFKKKWNFIEKIDCPVHFISDNTHLDPNNLQVKGLLKTGVFDTYKVVTPWFEGCREILDEANKLKLGKEYFVILWFGETHQPFSFGPDKNEKWDDFVKRVDHYNRGFDNITDDEMLYMHQRQIDACTYIIQNAWNDFLGSHRDATIIITADHGESFGEQHKFGHGCGIHRTQFFVPFVSDKKVKY